MFNPNATKPSIPNCNEYQVKQQNTYNCNILNGNPFVKSDNCRSEDTRNKCPVTCNVCQIGENYTSNENPVLKSIGQNYIESTSLCENNNDSIDSNTVYFNLDENG